jgi:cytochrome c oxidase subunit II
MFFRKVAHIISAALAGLAADAAFAAYSDVNLPPPGTQIGQIINDLHIFVLWICFFIFIVVFGAMFYSIVKHRKAAGYKAHHFHENATLEIVWTIIPFLIIIGMAIPATKVVLAQKDTGAEDMTIKITGYQWRWEYDYLKEGVKFISVLSTPYEQTYENAPKTANYILEVDKPLVVPVGKKVRLLITSSDVIHGWFVQTLGVNQYGIPGFIKDAWFKVERAGTYRGQCSQICGKEHSYMPIVVEAKSAEDYAAWLQQQKAAAGKVAAAQ